METTSSIMRSSTAKLQLLHCLVLAFYFAGCSKEDRLLSDFDSLEKEALRYGTVSVGAVRVTDYNDRHLEDARQSLRTSLTNLRMELGGSKPESPEVRRLSQAAGISNSGPVPSGGPAKPKPDEGQSSGLSEIELVGLRMAALKLVESELEDVNLSRISAVEKGFRRVEVSLDCSAWVRGNAAASLVYIDLYPYKVDIWCHEAAKIMEEWWQVKLCSNQRQQRQKQWDQLIDSELAGLESDNAFKSLTEKSRRLPDMSQIDLQRDPNDWVAFCHRWLDKNGLFPHIVHVERMGKVEYMILAQSDHSVSKFGAGFQHAAGPSVTWGVESGEKSESRTAMVQPLSLAFVAGDRRAGWLFMPSQIRAGTMPPTERRLRMVVDVPDCLSKLAIHVHKQFLGPDLGVLQGAAFSKQVKNLDKTRDLLERADMFYRRYKQSEPRHYRLLKTRMRNLLYQGWAEEITVDIPFGEE